jgi:hypothetical protein
MIVTIVLDPFALAFFCGIWTATLAARFLVLSFYNAAVEAFPAFYRKATLVLVASVFAGMLISHSFSVYLKIL